MNVTKVDPQQESEINRFPMKAKRYVSLDHWRGIACLLVVINHATLPLCSHINFPAETAAVSRTIDNHIKKSSPPAKPVSPIGRISNLLVFLTTKMEFGVGMFFVISGYCITASGLSLRRSGCKISEYFWRRFIRIYPPFWCALICSIIGCFAIDRAYPGLLKMTPWALPVPWDLSAAQWLSCVTLTGTWLGYFTGQPPTLCFPIQSWTLCYEEQFYAVIGIILAFSGRHFYRSAMMITVAAFGTIAAATYVPGLRPVIHSANWLPEICFGSSSEQYP